MREECSATAWWSLAVALLSALSLATDDAMDVSKGDKRVLTRRVPVAPCLRTQLVRGLPEPCLTMPSYVCVLHSLGEARTSVRVRAYWG